MTKQRVQIRPLKTTQEFHACERIQEIVWGSVGVSGELLSVTHKYGGAVVGAMVNGRVVGFIYAFLARRKGRLIHWSHLMAVEPKFRDLGLGFRMKLAHRQQALAAGISSICWTYDPLQSRNAALNIGRLGGCAEDFIPNCYGRFESAIERGLESDRFVVNWRINSTRVARRLNGVRPKGPRLKSILNSGHVNETRLNVDGFPENRRLHLALSHATLVVEIPKETDRMRSEAMGLARRWRLESRRIFSHYFSLGYHVEDIVPPGPLSDGRCLYVLRRHHASA